MNVWARVTKSAPCPICQKGDWCTIDKDTGAVCCMRIQSEKSLANGGYLHRGTEVQRTPLPPKPKLTGYEDPDFDANLWWRTTRKVLNLETLDLWAERLSLPSSFLMFMGATTACGMLCFPMRDGNGKICGIRTRDPDGSKRAITGSRAGIFLPGVHDSRRDAIICEGPTDAAAAMALGFEPIGRPSCTGCERHVIDTCKRMKFQKVTICADSDAPGIAGAKKLSDVLKASRIAHRIVSPVGHKDLRDWFKSGVTRATIDLQWSQAEWRT